MRALPGRWVLPLALLPLTTCTQLVAPDVGGAIAYVHLAPVAGNRTALFFLERPGPGAHLRTRQFRLDPVTVEYDRPSWSPDGRHLMLSGIGASGPQLYTMSYPEGQLTQVTSSPKRKLCPSWSPDGTRVVVARDVDINQGTSELVIIHLATKIETPVFAPNPTLWVNCPQWSPDGTKIVFQAGVGSQVPTEIYVVFVSGLGLVNLTNTPDDHEGFPAWSPDGRQIAFTAGVGIQIMNADGSGRSVAVTEGACPSWSPGGEAIAFMADLLADPYSFPIREVFAADLRDHDREQLTFLGSGLVWCPAWQP